MRWPTISRNFGRADAAHGVIEIAGAAPLGDWLLRSASGLLLLPFPPALLFQRLGRFLLVLFLSIHTLAHDSLLAKVNSIDQFLVLRRLNILRSPCRPVESRGGLGGFSPTRLMRSSRPTTRTFCNSLNICFGMPSGKSTKLWSSRISTRPMCTPSIPDSFAIAPTILPGLMPCTDPTS